MLLFSLTACTQQADSEEQNISADIVESNTDVEKVGNGSDMPQNDTVEGLNQDILAASAGTMVTQIITCLYLHLPLHLARQQRYAYNKEDYCQHNH